MNKAELSFLLGVNADLPLVEALNASNCDEMAEFDLETDSYRHLYHVIGKYFVASTDGGFSSVYDFARKHVVHPDDVPVFKDLMDPKNIRELLPKAEIPYFRAAEFRYRLQDGRRTHPLP